MKLTFRGQTIVALEVGLIFSALPFQQVFIAIAFLVVLSFLVSEVLWITLVTRNPNRRFTLALTPEEVGSRHVTDADESVIEAEGNEDKETTVTISKQLNVGEELQMQIALTNSAFGEVSLSVENEFLEIVPSKLERKVKEGKLTIKFKTPYSGDYSTEKLGIEVTGPLSLVVGSCSVPLTLNLAVIPKVLSVASTSLRILSRIGIGEIPLERPGIGTEFYDLRTYQQGDDYRSINWKASARSSGLIVNQRMKELGNSFYIVLEAYSPDHFDQDRLATAFLCIANELAQLDVSFGIVVHDGLGSVTIREKIGRATRMLPIALNAALEFAGIDEEQVRKYFGYDSIELGPMSSLSMQASSHMLANSNLKTNVLSDMRKIAFGQLKNNFRKGVSLSLIELLKESAEGERPAIFYVTGMYGDSTNFVVELGTLARSVYGAEFYLINPTAPWTVSPTENEGYEEYQRYLRKLRALRSANIEYYVGEPIGVTKELLS